MTEIQRATTEFEMNDYIDEAVREIANLRDSIHKAQQRAAMINPLLCIILLNLIPDAAKIESVLREVDACISK